MQLTPDQIVSLGSEVLTAAKSLYAVVESGMAKLNAHNATHGAPHVNAGPMSVALGTASTVVEQLEKHIAENTPKPATPPTPPGA